MAFPNIKKRAAPLRNDVADTLRQAIIDGQLEPGKRLVERELILMLGVSRTVIREALRQLEAEKIIETIPNKGPAVRRLTRSEAEDLYQIRSVLEGLAAKMFVERASDAEVRSITEAYERVIQAYEKGYPDGIVNVKNEFYQILYDGADSKTLSETIDGIYGRIWRWRALGLKHPKRTSERSKQSTEELGHLCRAFQQRDADLAEQIARREVMNAAGEIVRIFEKENKDAL